MATQKQVDILSDALRHAISRFDDLATIIEKDGGYSNAGFMKASARRCRQALAGKPFHAELDEATS